MTKDEIIKKLRDMAKYPTVTIPRDSEALKEAADLLAQPERDYERGFIDGMQKQMQSSVDKAVNRMAQPEQEPIGTVKELFTQAAWERLDLRGSTQVYTTPPQPEPVIDKSAAIRIATSLGWEPKRKPLTDEEIRRIELTVHGYRRQPLDVKAFARAIEAKLKEKNT